MLSLKISGPKVRRMREDRGLSVAAVAAAVGRSASAVYKIEQGRAQPSAEVYVSFKELFDANDSDLVEEIVGSAA